MKPQKETCTNCGGAGVVGHDCGEDTCCCLHPDDNMLCFYCEGSGLIEMDYEDSAS